MFERPIVVGPWCGEVGFELLYWIPFLAYLKETGLDLQNSLVVSRGGCASWYAHISPHYVDLFSIIGPEEFQRINSLRRNKNGRFSRKQLTILPEELDLIGKITRTPNPDILHPSQMFQKFLESWKTSDFSEVNKLRRIQTFIPGKNKPSWLPESYVAVKFYRNSALPNSPKFVNDFVLSLAKRTNVVLLHTGLIVDDHSEYTIEGHPRIFRIPNTAPNRNLAVQTTAIRYATAFYGTYGGFSYLPPCLEVPTTAFYSKSGKFLPYHLQVAQADFQSTFCLRQTEE